MVGKLRGPSRPIVKAETLLAQLINLRNNEMNARLRRAHFSITLNTAAIAAGFLRIAAITALEGKMNKVELIALAFGGSAAIAMNVLWFTVVKRNTAWLNYWNTKILELENNANFEGGFTLYTDSRFIMMMDGRYRFAKGWLGFTAIVILAWAILVTFVLALLRKGG